MEMRSQDVEKNGFSMGDALPSKFCTAGLHAPDWPTIMADRHRLSHDARGWRPSTGRSQAFL
jgi:hypothetical protein